MNIVDAMKTTCCLCDLRGGLRFRIFLFASSSSYSTSRRFVLLLDALCDDDDYYYYYFFVMPFTVSNGADRSYIMLLM